MIILGCAALALLTLFSLVVVLPLMIVVAMVRARRRRVTAAAGSPTDPDAAFAELVSREWPGEATLLRPPDPFLR